MAEFAYALVGNVRRTLHLIIISLLGIATGTALFFILMLPLRYVIAGLLAVLAPFLAFLFGQWKNFFLVVVILGIPLQVKTTLYGYTLNQIGGPGGIDLLLADCALIALYIHWLYECLIRKHERTVYFSSIELLILISIFISCISLLEAVDLTLGVIDLLRMVKVTLLYLYLANNIKQTKELKLVLFMLFVGVFIHNIVSIGQYSLGGRRLGLAFLGEVQEWNYLGWVSSTQERPGGLMQGANTSAVYLICIMPFVFTSLFWIKGRAEVAFCLSILASCIFVLVITLSRAGWLGFLVSFSTLLYLAVKKKFIQYKKHFHYCLLFTFVSVVFLTFFSTKIIDRIFYASHLSGYFRSSVNEMTITMIYSHPIFGLGLNNYQQNAPDYFRDMPDPRNVSHLIREEVVVHNLYLLVTAETGLLGLIVFLIILYLLLKRSLFIFRSDKPIISSIGIACFCFVLGFMASEIFDFSYRLDQLFYLFWALAGLTVAASHMERHSTGRQNMKKK